MNRGTMGVNTRRCARSKTFALWLLLGFLLVQIMSAHNGIQTVMLRVITSPAAEAAP